MTKTALEKINALPNKSSLNGFLARLTTGFSMCNEDMVEEYSYKLRAYLLALDDAGIISKSDVRCLYLYYKLKCENEAKAQG